MPLHSPHVTDQSRSCFLQEHLRVSQSCLHVHGPDRLLSQSTATLANTPERCGKTVLPVWEADCAAARLCCFSIPSRGTVGNAKHPGPRQSFSVRAT